MNTGMLVAIEGALILGIVLALAVHQLVSVRRSMRRDRARDEASAPREDDG